MIRAFFVGLVVGAALLFAGMRYVTRDDTTEIAALERWERASNKRRGQLAAALARQVPPAVRWRTQWDTLTRLDSLRLTDTLWVREVLATGDSAVRSCSLALTTCQALAAEATAAADSANRRADLWRRVARGRFLRPSAELLYSGGLVRGAVEVEAGRRWSAVARLEVDTLARVWFGGRWQF